METAGWGDDGPSPRDAPELGKVLGSGEEGNREWR
jgi:hypothetical protein